MTADLAASLWQVANSRVLDQYSLRSRDGARLGRTADQLPRRGAVPLRRARLHAVRPIGRGALRPAEPPIWQINPKLIFDSWGRVAARKLLILLVWGTDFSKV